MRVSCIEASTVEDVYDHLRILSPRSVILDVEPLVAYWNTGITDLDLGIRQCLEQMTTLPSVRVIAFATNSHRLPSVSPMSSSVEVTYRATAFKPFRLGQYRQLPRPGVIVGDQIATDGLLAWRLGYSFIRYRPERKQTPIGPQLMNLLGYPLPMLIFKRMQRPF